MTKTTKPKTPKKGIVKTLAMGAVALTAAAAPINKAEARGHHHHHHGRNVGAALVGGLVGGLVGSAVREALTPEPTVIVQQPTVVAPPAPVVVQ